jgi:BirA family biotin operon repressor/biotin-[acetyl-CoA-carboxylase] ligase
MKPKQYHIIHIEETASTNTCLMKLSKEKQLAEGTVIVTGNQTGGRGQRGNTWESQPNKNLTFSLLLYPKMLQAKNQFLLSQCVALAVKNTLLKYTTGIKIKWPNDIYRENNKICGILIENSLNGLFVEQSVIGIGININQDSFSGNTINKPTSLKLITGQEFELDVILNQILGLIYFYYEKLNQEPELIAQEYKNGLFSTGRFKDKHGEFQALIKDVKPDGMLILSDVNNTKREYYFKEVQFII